MTDGTKKLHVAFDEGIKRITFNRPERRNAVDAETQKLLRAALEASRVDETRVIILTGAGGAFCAGADLAALNQSEIKDFDVTTSLRDDANPIVMLMRELPVPIIARVDGTAVGIGCNYALACDIIIASERAVFAELFVRIGLMPDGGGTYFLPRLVGYHKAFELMATGDTITAEEAYNLGIVNKVVPFSELNATVNKLAARLVASPRIALEKIKAGLNHAANTDLASALDYEAVNQAACFHSPDFVEGVTAFLQKRKPVFSG
ncbi:MAG: enoyl-CoA hydratase-related protein [Pyrinomonadaceae bacterium MAG19_C2-C3]|nr:enoyl-CoA hydratase-related protein [Pyrinomonadaceae bacterium MAG19_C2-C3]